MSEPSKAFSRRAALSAAAGVTAAAALAGSAQAQPQHGRLTANGRTYRIRRGAHQVVIAGVAATLLSWRVEGEELLLTHSADEVGEGYQGKTILPWPNRIDGGQYEFGGRKLQVPVNEPERNTALHGLMNFVEWDLVRHLPDRVELEHVLPPSYGYPFHLSFRITYAVDEQGVTTTLTARNIGTEPAPYGTANHTYIAAGTGRIDDMVLELPAEAYYVTDDRLLPIDKRHVAGTEYDFRTARRIGSTEMDTAFTALRRQPDGTAVTRFHRADGRAIELWVDRAHGYLQVYTDDSPEADRPPRAGITVEPMTCAPNAFVTGDGLAVIEPGGTHRGRWGLRLR